MAGNTSNEMLLGDVVANADLSAQQFNLVKIDATADRAVILAVANTDVVLGVLCNKPTLGVAALVQIDGEAKVRYGAAVVRGAALMSDTAGHAITQTTTNPVFAYALESGASGEVHSVTLV